MDDLVGFLQEEGWSEADIDEALSPMDRYDGRPVADDSPTGEAGSGVAAAIRHALEQAAAQTPLPGPQSVIPRGQAVPLGERGVKPIRVDSEESYAAFKRESPEAGLTEDMPENLDDWTSEIERIQRAELMGEPTSVLGYNVGPTGDQCCLLCGRVGAGSAVCADCRAKHAKALMAVMAGFGERGAASEGSLLGMDPDVAAAIDSLSEQVAQMNQRDTQAFANLEGAINQLQAAQAQAAQAQAARSGHSSGRSGHFGRFPAHLMGFGERGSAADMYGLSAGTASLHELLGYTARQLELMGWTERQIELLGWTANQQELIDECDALESPCAPCPTEPISFYNSAIDSRHVIGFKRGAHLYGSIRLTGWDRQPKILTAACGADKPLGVIIGALEGKLPPAAVLAHAEPLSHTLGAGSLLPRIAAASPGVLRAVHGLKAPIICAAIPSRGRR